MNFLKKVGNTVGHTAGGIVETAAKDVQAAEQAVSGGVTSVFDTAERVFQGPGGRQENVKVVYKNSNGEDTNVSRYTMKKSSKSGGGKTSLTGAAGNILHTAAKLATDAADTVYVKPVVLAADLASPIIGKENAAKFHEAEDMLRTTVLDAADTVINPVVMVASSVERLFGQGGDVSEVIIVEDGSQTGGVSTYKVAVTQPPSETTASETTTTKTISGGTTTTITSNEVSAQESLEYVTFTYDPKYPLTAPTTTPNGINYRIGIIADLDKASKGENGVFFSKLQKGYLTYNPTNRKVVVSWDSDFVSLSSTLNEGGRGMELSELNIYNGKLYTVDDKTGYLFEIEGSNVKPFARILDGDGSVEKGFKGEWGTIKGGILYIGGHGTPRYNAQGELLDINAEWVKKVLPTGEVYHVNWHFNFEAIRNAVGITSPGYITHESGCWSDIQKKWFFLPRKINPEAFEDEQDEISGSNILISCDEDFRQFEITEIGPLVASHGFSSFKFIPGTNDEIFVALKSKEEGGQTATYILVATIDGEILLDESQISGEKFEGIEFI